MEAASYSDRMIDRSGQVFDRGAPVRAAALNALTVYQNDEVQGPGELLWLFMERLHDESPEVVRAAARALAANGSAEAAWALVDLLAQAGSGLTADAREEVLDALRACACPGISERWSGKVVDIRDTTLDETDRQDLMELLEADAVADPRQGVFDELAPLVVGTSHEADAAKRAETILSWCMPARLDGLAALLEQHDVSGSVIRLAGESGDQNLLDPLVGLLEHPAPDARAQAATALGSLSDTAAVIPLMGATSDPDVEVRRAAINALESLGSAGVTAALAVFAHTAALGSKPDQPALTTGPWARTLSRLTERAAASEWARRLRGDDEDPMAPLTRARGRYESMLDEPNPPQG